MLDFINWEIHLYLAAFPPNSDEQVKASQRLGNIVAFAAFPSQQWALFNKHPAYIYEISNVPTDLPGFPHYGAFHTSEGPYVLHTLHLWKRNWTAHDYQVQELVSSYWLNFIKTGNQMATVYRSGKNMMVKTDSFWKFKTLPFMHSRQ